MEGVAATGFLMALVLMVVGTGLVALVVVANVVVAANVVVVALEVVVASAVAVAVAVAVVPPAAAPVPVPVTGVPEAVLAEVV